MRSRYLSFVLSLALSVALPGWGQSATAPSSPQNGAVSESPQARTKVPTGVILVKGAWSSASDSTTPVPEGGSVTDNVFTNAYFGITYRLPNDWTEKYTGPPPSESGRYVLAQIQRPDDYKGPSRGNILITAQDLFFTSQPTTNALELTAYEKENLQSDYKLEPPPTAGKIAGRLFTSFAYWSPVAEMHWYILGTEIRCHAVQFILTSRDTKLLKSLVDDMNKMELPVEASPDKGEGGGASPVCIKGYANDENLIARVDPILTEHRFTSVPVRIIIDKNGKVRHIHFLSAYPDQTKVIMDALAEWKFKPYLKDGQPVEVETGIIFGRPQIAPAPTKGRKPTAQ